MNRKDSYTSANALPIKVFKDSELMRNLISGRVIPRHLQLSPTNRCDLKCAWCSCSARELRQELTFDELMEIVGIASGLGVQGVTITGGGEPLLHPNINELISGFSRHGIKVGLVTNGKTFRRLNEWSMGRITWCRVSFSDDRDISKYVDSFEYFAGFPIDKAFSYVLTEGAKFDNLLWVVEFANRYNFTHIRLVPDLYSADKLDDRLEEARAWLRERVDDSLVIYQPRKHHVEGHPKCLLSILKPFIAADGYIYPCCGVQYALSDEYRGFPDEMRMGRYTDLPRIVQEQEHFNGSKCVKCYYGEYNHVLNAVISEVRHGEWV